MYFSLILLKRIQEDINDAFTELHEYLVLSYKLCFSKAVAKVTKRPNEAKWITGKLKKSCVVKRELYFRYHKSSTYQIQHKSGYKKYKQLLQHCMLESQRIENKMFLNKSKNKCRSA